jgi:hypothetical protein
MDFNNSQIKLENSSQRLADNLETLEQLIFDRLSDNQYKNYSALIIEQNTTLESQNKNISKLNEEINKLSKEIEFLQQRNKILTQKIIHFRNQSSNIVEVIENDIIKIEEILKNHEC